MAYIVSTTQTATASAASYTVTLGAHVSGDLLLVFLTQDVGGTTIAPDATSATAGWAMIGTQAASGSSRSAWAWLIADSASEVNPVFTGATDDWIGTCLVIRDAHATAPFGATPTTAINFKRSDYTGVASAASNKDGDLDTTTIAEDGILLIYSWGSDGALYPRGKINEITGVDRYSATAISHIIGYKQQQSVGVAPTATMYRSATTNGGNGWILAVRNKSSGAFQPDIRPDVNELKWYGTYNEEYDGSTTWNAPSTFCTGVTDFGGFVLSATAPTVAVNTVISDAKVWNPSATTLTSTENITLLAGEGGVGAWVGGWHTIPSTDLTGKMAGFMWEITSGSGSSIQGSEGLLVGFSDGTNCVFYQVASKALGWPTLLAEFSFVAPGNGTAYDSVGTVATAISACTEIGFFLHRITNSTGARAIYLRDFAVFGTTSLTGGGSSYPTQFQDFQRAITGWGQWDYARLTGSAQVLAKSSVQIGDGTNKTYFDGAAQSFEYPQAWSASAVNNWQMFWNAAANSVGLSVYAKAADTINLASGVAATDTAQNLSINASSAAAADATYSFAQSFVGWRDPIDNKGLTWNGATFKECGTVTIAGGGDLTNCTIAKTTSTHAPLTITANGTVVTTSTITVADTSITTDHHISLGASVTSCTLNGVTLSGAAGTDKIYSALASGTLTITVDGTGTAIAASDVTFVGGSTASAVIAAPALYQEVVVSGFTAGSRIQIYDATSATELFNGTASAGDTVVSGSTATWTDPTAAAGNRAIRVRVAYVNGTSAELWQQFTGLTCGTTSGTESVTYPVTPIDDDTYNSNAVDGSTVTGITFTDAATDLVNINIAADTVPLKDIYAAFVYWLFTAAGIDDDVAYIDAPNTANYIMTSMKFRNTSTDPLKITGGYFYDSTGSVENCVDVAGSSGNIYPMPEHVVPYQTTGTYAITGDIATILTAVADVPADVLTAAAATPIASNIKKVNDITVDGTGVVGDEWGPV
jgi:hypothetical protein